MPIQFRSRIPEARAAVHRAIADSTQQTFELDIKPQAVEASPVTPEGYERNLALSRKRPGGTGTNRRSIDTETIDTPEGPKATLFTQSGYGGYLEVGTSKMRPQPYLYPAFIENAEKIPLRTKEKIAEAGITRKQ